MDIIRERENSMSKEIYNHKFDYINIYLPKSNEDISIEISEKSNKKSIHLEICTRIDWRFSDGEKYNPTPYFELEFNCFKEERIAQFNDFILSYEDRFDKLGIKYEKDYTFNEELKSAEFKMGYLSKIMPHSALPEMKVPMKKIKKLIDDELDAIKADIDEIILSLKKRFTL